MHQDKSGTSVPPEAEHLNKEWTWKSYQLPWSQHCLLTKIHHRGLPQEQNSFWPHIQEGESKHKTDQCATPGTGTDWCQKVRNNRKSHVCPITTDHLWSVGTSWQGMLLLPPLQGIQIPYTKVKTNGKVLPSVLCTSCFKDTKFVQGAVHTAGSIGSLSCTKYLSFNTVFYFFLKTLQRHRHFSGKKKDSFSSRQKRLNGQTPTNCQLFSTLPPFPPISWSVRSTGESRAEPNPGRTCALGELQIHHTNNHIQPKEPGV